MSVIEPRTAAGPSMTIRSSSPGVQSPGPMSTAPPRLRSVAGSRPAPLLQRGAYVCRCSRQPRDPVQLGGDIGLPRLAIDGGASGCLLDRLEGRQCGLAELAGPSGEEVAQVPLREPDPVARVLADD